MASEAPSWADQWGTGGIGVMAAEETTNGKKEVAGKTKAGINRAKIVAFIGVNWMKNLVQRKNEGPYF
ncbi:hypothetical protein V5N11_019748 [Cardamine amara subsp. amara]|uniref:Uncharacterized protein n=1 Tax=Cardamine amara subsp. amara TaxID=228776 RepID=A0ABD1A6U8_CARAN